MHCCAIRSKIPKLQTLNWLRALDSSIRRIAVIVEKVADDKTLPRRERNLKQILHDSALPSEGKLVRFENKLDNFSDLFQAVFIGWRSSCVAKCFKRAGEMIQCLCGTNSALESQLEMLL